MWDAEHAPENVGFSHNVLARTARQGDGVVVEEITKVQSVDLVADPATTRGLFEAAAAGAEPPAGQSRAESQSSGLAGLTTDELKRQRPDLVQELLQEQADRLGQLQAEVDRLIAAEALHQRRALARRLLAESRLPDPETAEGWARTVVSAGFLESLLAAPSEQAMREMVEERARLVRGAGGFDPAGHALSRPLSRDQHQVDRAAPADVKGFVEAVT